MTYANPRWAVAYQFEQYQSETDQIWGHRLASLEYYAIRGLSLLFRYERLQNEWARWQQTALTAWTAGVEWQVTPAVQFRLLYRLPTASTSPRSNRFSEGITFSEVAIHF